MAMMIREAQVDDALEIMELHERSVLGLCQDDYTLEQLQEWVSQASLKVYQLRLENHRTWIANGDEGIIGYVRWNPMSNELCSVYVDPGCTRQGIGTKLMTIACEDAAAYGVKEMWLDASLTAVPFYKILGWQTKEKRMHGSLPCLRMTRTINHD